MMPDPLYRHEASHGVPSFENQKWCERQIRSSLNDVMEAVTDSSLAEVACSHPDSGHCHAEFLGWNSIQSLRCKGTGDWLPWEPPLGPYVIAGEADVTQYSRAIVNVVTNSELAVRHVLVKTAA